MDVLCIDPGSKHTGLAVWSDVGGWGCDWSSEIDTAQLPDWLSRRFDTNPPDVVVYEQYRLRSGTAQGGSSLAVVESIGVTHALAGVWGIPVHAVTPSTRASAVKRIRASNIPWVGTGPHAHDAQAIGLAYLKLSIDDVRLPT